MTKQDYYDLLVRTSLEGRFPSSKPPEYEGCSPYCLYRGPDGRKCAAGLLIPDDDYREDFEGKTVWDDNNVVRCIKLYLPEGMTTDEIYNCQQAHDSSASDYYYDGLWDHEGFVDRLNELDCFADVHRVFLPETKGV